MPPQDLAHLKEIILTNTGALSRERKRHRGSSGAPISRILGRYSQRWKGQPAYIEIFVNNILEDVSWFDRRIPVLRNSMFAKVLYHEIGHHVQMISNSKLVKKEAFADEYALRLRRRFAQHRYRHIRPWYKAFYWFIKKIGLVKLIDRHSGVRIEKENSRM